MRLMVLLDHVVVMLTVVLSHRRRLWFDSRVVVHVWRCVMSRRLRRMMAMLMVNNGLVMKAIVVVDQVLIVG